MDWGSLRGYPSIVQTEKSWTVWRWGSGTTDAPAYDYIPTDGYPYYSIARPLVTEEHIGPHRIRYSDGTP